MWDNYILSEQRSSAAAILIAERDSFGIASAVEHTRGAFNAISAAAGEQTPALARSLLGGDGPLHEAPLALELAQQRFDAYNTLKRTIAPLQGRTLERVKVYRKEIERLEARVGRLSRMETAVFLLAVFCVLVLNLAGAQRDRV
ncbi:MAG: hypothetical protein OXG72_14430 [Acidobacteria bacterium]|nr:hypothetical protein [Acidobacteriota bacterium]